MPLELPDGWRDQLPDDIKDNGALNDVTTIDQMATMVVNGRKLQSRQVSIPSEDASPEQREEFLKDLQSKIPDLVYVGEDADLNNLYDRMGRPKEASEYDLGEVPDPLKDNFAKLAMAGHEAGVTKGQMKALSASILDDYKDSQGTQALAMEEAINAVKKEYGEAADVKMKAASEFAKQLGFDSGFVEAVGQGIVGVDNMKALEKVMDGFESPGPRIGEEQGDSGFTHLTPAQAETQLAEIMNNKQHPYWDASNPGAHKAAIEKVVELTRMADAGKEVTETDKFRSALAGSS